MSDPRVTTDADGRPVAVILLGRLTVEHRHGTPLLVMTVACPFCRRRHKYVAEEAVELRPRWEKCPDTGRPFAVKADDTPGNARAASQFSEARLDRQDVEEQLGRRDPFAFLRPRCPRHQ